MRSCLKVKIFNMMAKIQKYAFSAFIIFADILNIGTRFLLFIRFTEFIDERTMKKAKKVSSNPVDLTVESPTSNSSNVVRPCKSNSSGKASRSSNRLYPSIYSKLHMFRLVSDQCIITNEGEFDMGNFNSFNDTYKAVEELIKEIRTRNHIHSYKRNGSEFLLNKKHHTAVLLKSVSIRSKRNFERKQNRKTKFKYDVGKRVTTVGVAKGLILHFLNNTRFAKYALAIPIGTTSHEACLVFSTSKNGINAIYYNPNYSESTRGVESSQIATDILQSLSQQLNSCRAYHSDSGNVESMCSALAWIEIFFFVSNGISPFKNSSINLADYRHFTTQYAYDKYHKKLKQKSLKHYGTWHLMDKRLKNIATAVTIDITIQFLQSALDILKN